MIDPASPEETRGLLRVRIGLFTIAVLLRVAYALDAQRLPFVAAPLFDSAVYERQAQALLAGDFGHPTLLAFGPLTGWFLAATGVLAVPLQLTMGVATAALTERLARDLAGPRAGLAALALYIAYGLPVFYETKWMSESLGLFLLTASLVLGGAPSSTAQAPASTENARAALLRQLAAGALLGLATLARASLVLVLPFAPLAVLAAHGSARARLLQLGAAGLGLGLVLGLNGAWNLHHAGRFVPVILVSQTAARASTTDWTGSLSPFGQDGQPPSPWDVVEQAEVVLGRAPPSTGAAGLRTAESRAGAVDVVGVLRGAPRKLLALFSDIETSFDYGYYGERRESRALGWLPGSMGTYLMLALVGVVALVRRREARRLLALAPVPLGVALTFVLFHPSSRYRLPLAPVVVAVAGAGVAAVWEALHEASPARRLRARLLAAALALASVVFATRQIAYELADPSAWDLRVAEGELARGDTYEAQRRLARAWRTSLPGSGTRRHIEALERATGIRVPR